MTSELNAIKRVQNGDAASFEPLVAAYQRPLMVLARNMLSDQSLALEAVQDTFLAAFANIAAFDPDKGGFSSWLYAIARNKCRNAGKRAAREVKADLEQVADSRDVERSCAESEFLHQLDRALDRLPEQDKAVFVLAEISELPLAEVARMEGLPVGTVKSRLSRTKEKLRRMLAPHGR